jgi:uncharacterized protein YndB with AHSA1/START domain
MIDQPAALEISRLFDAPCERVFAAWATADRIARWFSPQGCSVPDAEVEFRAGGVFAVTMRLPDGSDSLCRGAFEEVTPPSRLVFVMDVEMQGETRFRVRSAVDFVAQADKTLMTVKQTYELFDPDYAGAPAGAREGWRTTLDKLAEMLAGAAAPATHGHFALTRDLPHPPAAVYRAFAEADAKARWFAGGDAWTPIERSMEVRTGGREIAKGRWRSGVVTTFEAVYLDVLPCERLVYAYTMHLDAKKISASLATLEFSATPGGCRLKITEQGAFFDGYDDAGSRERGTRELIERMAASLVGK